MNIFALIAGVIVAFFVIFHFKGRLSYPILLFSFPFYYFIFAIYGNDYEAIGNEVVAGLLFFCIAFLAPKLERTHRLYLLAGGFILHGVYDVIHNQFFNNAGTPAWWPEYCGSVDIIIGCYLILLTLRNQEKLSNKTLKADT